MEKQLEETLWIICCLYDLGYIRFPVCIPLWILSEDMTIGDIVHCLDKYGFCYDILVNLEGTYINIY